MADPSAAFSEAKDSNGFYNTYRIVCIDVDGINKGVAPFGFGVRVDGKILSGALADTWTTKSIQKGK